MCGIVGLAGLQASPEKAQTLVTRMAEKIRHRGPDGGGVAFHGDVTLGMTRLAIVDVVHGQQPMTNDDGSIVIVYNGEVYNAPELRARLIAAGVNFRTRSDTEVILRAYEHDPEHVEEHLVGMWAFAIHDRRRKRLILSRDRFGIKPLFVAKQGSTLGFASELRCFDRSLPELASCFQLDHAAAHAMLSWSYVPENATIWKGVRRLPPATRYERDLDTGAEREHKYWELVPSSAAAQVRDLDEACTAVDGLLRRSVREHLESDVPVATFLSGGVDSSLIAMYAAQSSSKSIHAYTIGFTDPRFDESHFARAVAERLGIPIELRIFDKEFARHELVDALSAYDEPFGDSSSLATHLVSSFIGEKYKVALAGDGGDEVFAGYRKYFALNVRKPFSQTPRLRNALAGALSTDPRRRRPRPSALGGGAGHRASRVALARRRGRRSLRAFQSARTVRALGAAPPQSNAGRRVRRSRTEPLRARAREPTAADARL